MSRISVMRIARSTALTMSYSVRQATDTAVNASISTPVLPATATLAVTATALRAGSASSVTAILEIDSGWQSGMSSWVRLAAMMPAIRAAASTSPLGALPSRIISSVAGSITTSPLAVASRSVTALSETSTIRARPSSSRWVIRDLPMPGDLDMLGLEGCPGGLLQEGPGCRLDIALTHQTLTDEEGVDPRALEPCQIGRRADPALGHDERAVRQQRRQALAGLEPRLEGLEIAVVDPDQPALQPE